MKSISSSFKKGSPLLAVQASLINISRNKTYQLPIALKDFLKNTVETLFVRFPQEFGEVRRDFGDTMNDQWNSRVDITDVLSQFLNITIHPIASTLEEAQTKRARSSNINPSKMWATSSFEDMQKARVGGETSQANDATVDKDSRKRKTPDGAPRQVAAQATNTRRPQGKGKPDGGKASKGKGGSKGGSKGGPKGGSKGGSKGNGAKGKQHSPPFRPNWQPNGIPEPPPILTVKEAQRLWSKQCAHDKCYRTHDDRGWDRTAQKPSLYCYSCCEHLATKGWKGLWCKDNNQRSAFGTMTEKGRSRQQPNEKAHQAYTTLQDDSTPVSEGTWVKDSNAQGGWRWVAGEVRQVVQSEATQNDPYARAYMA